MRRLHPVKTGLVAASLLATCGLAAACASSDKDVTTNPAPRAEQSEQPAKQPASPAPDQNANEPADDNDCVAECIRDNQMRAVAAEQIERDCERECATPTE